MTDKQESTEIERQAAPDTASAATPAMEDRRAFLLGLGKWSQAVVFGAVAAGALLPERSAQAGWINRRGGGWGGSWVNRR